MAIVLSGKRRAEGKREDEERQSSPSARVEHAVIRDELGHGRRRQEATGQRKGSRNSKGEVKKNVGLQSHTKTIIEKSVEMKSARVTSLHLLHICSFVSFNVKRKKKHSEGRAGSYGQVG